MARVFSNLSCVVTDERPTRRPTRLFACPFMVSFGGNRVFLAYEAKLWHLGRYRFASTYREFFPALVDPNLYLYVTRNRRTGAYYFLCQVNDGDHAWIDVDGTVCMEPLIIYECPLENVHHLLLRLQRWVRRMLRRERVRPVLLRALTAEDCALGGLGRDIVEGVLLGMAFKAGV